ncbi:hypothetical protein PLANPX_4183 [Lacipirellula parvula]|uniref:Uncharacterized protein n=1 Tax=Lacipirellula parvula TaxID=2650471 RepID=A0A5K7XHY3_9BACT|nr:hypothetical protein PLANPX_4183 [Lacipirellula parvula]
MISDGHVLFLGSHIGRDIPTLHSSTKKGWIFRASHNFLKLLLAALARCCGYGRGRYPDTSQFRQHGSIFHRFSDFRQTQYTTRPL